MADKTIPPKEMLFSLPAQQAACWLVYDYLVKPRLAKTDEYVNFTLDDVYVVWYSFVLGNWKALVSTTLPDGMYYEVTCNSSKAEFYIDAYKKFDNVVVPLSDII